MQRGGRARAALPAAFPQIDPIVMQIQSTRRSPGPKKREVAMVDAECLISEVMNYLERIAQSARRENAGGQWNRDKPAPSGSRHSFHPVEESAGECDSTFHAGGAVQLRAKTNSSRCRTKVGSVSDNSPKLGGQRLSTLLYVDCALMRERLEPEDAVIAAHAALIDTTERQLAFQVMREESVDRHTAR